MNAQGIFPDAHEQMFLALGFRPFPGDTLRFAWSVEGGHVVYFDIHIHPATGGIDSLLTRTADAAQGNWTVPGDEAYGIFWRNLSPANVNVSYRYDLLPHGENEALLLAVVIVFGAAIIGVVIQTVIVRRRQRRREPSSPPEDKA
jgi:hypothetical protein